MTERTASSLTDAEVAVRRAFLKKAARAVAVAPAVALLLKASAKPAYALASEEALPD